MKNYQRVYIYIYIWLSRDRVQGGTALQLLKVPTPSSSRRRDGEQLLRQVVHFGAGPLILTDVSQDLHLGNSPDF